MQDLRKAFEYYLRAEYAIDMRILKARGFGDETVKQNIEDSLKRIKDKDSDGDIKITDLPGYPGTEFTDLSADALDELMRSVDSCIIATFIQTSSIRKITRSICIRRRK